MKFNLTIDKHYVKKILGHGQYSTTEEIYGNHNFLIYSKQRINKRAAITKALKNLQN